MYNLAMQSYAAGPELPLVEKTIGAVLADSAGRRPDSPALISRHQNVRLTYAELNAAVERTARGLWGLGLRTGDRIGIWSTNCAEWIHLQFASARLGVVLVNVNPAYRSHELAYVLRKSGMKALFLHEQDARCKYLEILNEARAGGELALDHTVLLDGATWEQMIERGEPFPEQTIGTGDVANIQYTSGTTGSPKGVLLTHRNLVNNAWIVGRAMHITDADSLCAPVPLYHCFGCVMSSLLSVVYGIPLVMPAATFDPLATIEAVAAERCTVLHGVPTMFIAELEHADFPRYDMSSLRTGIMAGAPCPIEVMKRVVSDMHCTQMTIAYGQTESSPAITMSDADDPLELRVATVGRVLPSTEVKIVSPTSGETLDAGERGELCTRGYLVMKGYDGDPEATRRAIDADGWLHTGDLATMDEDGFFTIVDRKKDVILAGAYNVYPRDVEEVLYEHPKVLEAAVVGEPDPHGGQSPLIKAVVVLKRGERATQEELLALCRERLDAYKVPKVIEFRTELPKNFVGKVLRRLLVDG
jgi:fatty-acyl-CoA synthase